MLLYLDAKDLINLLEFSNPISDSDFGEELRARGWELLNRLEELPIAYMADASIFRLELKEAVDAYSEGRAYQPVRPFVRRFDETIPIEGHPSTRIFLRFGIAETMFMLWTENPNVLRGFDRHVERYEEIVERDRILAARPLLRSHFPTALARNLRLLGIASPLSGVSALADWITSEPSRCPGNRLVFEIFHAISTNRTDRLKRSDLADFNLLYCLPYVHLATVDRRIYGYLGSLRHSTGLHLQTKCYRNVRDLLDCEEARLRCR